MGGGPAAPPTAMRLASMSLAGGGGGWGSIKPDVDVGVGGEKSGGLVDEGGGVGADALAESNAAKLVISLDARFAP